MYGSELSGVNADKGDLIRHALRVEGFEAAEPWMVGDRVHDIEAARKNGLATIGVLWGTAPSRNCVTPGPIAWWRPWRSCVTSWPPNNRPRTGGRHDGGLREGR